MRLLLQAGVILLAREVGEIFDALQVMGDEVFDGVGELAGGAFADVFW